MPIVLSPTSHGNGFGNTGVLDRDAGTGAPSSQKVDFTTPGIYRYQCLIHPFMHGTVIVS
jgi:plastocyanin